MHLLDHNHAADRLDRAFPLDEIAAAGAWLEADKHVGKVVIRT